MIQVISQAWLTLVISNRSHIRWIKTQPTIQALTLKVCNPYASRKNPPIARLR